MKKVVKGIVSFSLLVTAAMAPISALACSSGACAPVSSVCAPAVPVCAPVASCPTADPCAKPAMTCPETIYFSNDTLCPKHIQISYRGKGLFGMIFKRTLHITLAAGDVYGFTYDNATTWDKKASIRGVHSTTTHKINSGQVWLSSALEDAHGMPFGNSPKARTSVF